MPVPLLFKSSRNVPSPVTELTVTSIVVPLLAETDEMLPSAVPVFVRAKSDVSTPVTLSLNVTRYVTLVALVTESLGAWRLMELTEGPAEAALQAAKPIRSTMVIPSVPSPLMLEIVTVRVVPVPESTATVPVASPVVLREILPVARLLVLKFESAYVTV